MNDEELSLERKTFDEKFKSLTYKAGQYTTGILAFGIAIWWIFYGTVEIIPTSLSITDRIGLTICTTILALSYCKLISRGGFKSAKESSRYKVQTKAWADLIDKNIGDRQAINKFARDEALTNLNNIRKQNLENNEMVYSEFYDNEGKFIGIGYNKRKDLTRWQKKVIRKLLRIRIQVPNLFGASHNKVFGIHKEENQRKYELKTDSINALIRIAMSVVSVGFMFNFLGFSLGSMVYALFQIVLWTASGFSQRLKNYDWVMNTALPQIVEKKLMLMAWDKLDQALKDKYVGIQKQQELIPPVEKAN